MPKRDENKYNITIENEPQEVTEIRRKILDSFSELEFIEEGHKYYLRGEELISVSAVTDLFDEPFDEVNQAIAYAKKHGETAQYWLDKWKFTNLKATITGSSVHEFAESMAWVTAGHPELITPNNRYKYIREKNWLIPTRHKEEAALQFWSDFPSCMHIVLPETRVYSGVNPQLPRFKQNYAGTFDLLLYYKDPVDDRRSGLVLCDWKTNSSLTNSFARNKRKMMLEPFGNLYSEALSHYTLQQSLYQIPLEDIGLKVIGRRIIWLKDDGTYEKIRLDDITKTLRNVL